MARSTSTVTASEAPEAPRFATAWAALVYALCALSLAWPVLTGKFLGNVNSDQYLAGYAFREFAASYFKANGAIPQWNPYLMGGMPFIAAMHGDIFYPTFWLRLIMPVGAAMAWGMILHFFLSGLATYWFLRQAARLSFFAAVVGGVAYMMGGQVSSLVSAGHDGKLFVSALFPLVLLALTWGMRDGKRYAWGLLAFLIGLAVLSPHPQLLQYLLLTAGAWALFLAFGGVGNEKLPVAEAVQRLAMALGSVLLGAAMGAIQYLPVREYVEWSPRAGGRDYEYSTSFSFPLEEVINTYLPQFSGILDAYWGRNGIHFHSEYVGAVVFLLASAGFGTMLVTLFWAFGGFTPFYKLIYYVVPGTKFFRAPMTIMYINSFAIATLAALGTERLLTGGKGTKFVYGWMAAAAAVVVFAMVGGFTAIGNAVAVRPEFAERVDANATAVRLDAMRTLLFVGWACIMLLLMLQRKVNTRVAGWSLVLITALDLFSVERLYWDFTKPAKELFATDQALDVLKAETQPTRVISFALPTFPAARRDPFLEADGLMTHRIRQSMIGYHGNELGRYQQFVGKNEGYDQMGNPTFWALSNSNYLLTNTDSLPIPGAQVVVRRFANAAGTTVSLFKLPGEHSLAWVVPAIMKYPDAAVLEAVRAPNFPTRSLALFDTSSKVEGVQLTTPPAPLAISTTVTTYDAGHIAVTLSAPAPKGSALMVSENYYPGWHVTIDGKPGNVERADYVLMGIPLPEGAKSVELTFDSATYQKGKLITFVALLLAGLAVAAGVFTDRRRTGVTS
jgi:hypothetical protein